MSAQQQAVLDLQDPYYEFEAWLGIPSNRDVYSEFCDIALEARRRGMKRWSARGIVHVLRFQRATRDSDPTFKINNNITPMMARAAMRDYPELRNFFEVRS